MKKSVLLLAMLLSIPQFSAANSNYASSFVDEVKSAADSDGILNASIDIECPADSASGKIVISKASYDINHSKGVFVFKSSSETPIRMTSIVTEYPDDDFTADSITGMGFIFTMPNGQFFVDIFKDGKSRAGVNKNGQSGIKWIDCKILKPV